MTDFKSLLENYKVILFDAYGVVKNYKGLIPGIESTFNWLDEQQKAYYILTNDASRSPELLAESYYKSGLNHITPDKIISSGMLAKEFLDLKVKQGLVAYLGTEDSAHYIEHPGLETLPLQDMTEENINDITALVLLDDEGFDWMDGLNKAVNLLRRRTIPSILFYLFCKLQPCPALRSIPHLPTFQARLYCCFAASYLKRRSPTARD